MTVSEACLKFFVSGANFTFALGGLALVIVGVLYKLNLDDYTNALPSDYQAINWAPTLTIVVGSIIFVIAFLGCCGAIRESTCLLTTYAVILLVIFLLQIAVGVFVFLEIKDKNDFKVKIDNSITQLFSQNDDASSRELRDFIQSQLKCCGPKGPSFITDKPKSCYPNEDVHSSIYTEGCINVFYDFIIKSMEIIGIVVLTLSALEVVGCVFSLCLSSSIKNRERRFRY
ncbi:unnamed protein product [Psylliodes chrysocephalus]|uniref:Tetraspanin n=1 Tax=Psylliodes chrysocephalus TaxID=3402493 RepID=A0A9P0GGY1_9CUCU|nr:unnamed protein product [Psylliodes chrysocephala]